jgi:hypothetical protein
VGGCWLLAENGWQCNFIIKRVAAAQTKSAAAIKL